MRASFVWVRELLPSLKGELGGGRGETKESSGLLLALDTLDRS